MHSDPSSLTITMGKNHFAYVSPLILYYSHPQGITTFIAGAVGMLTGGFLVSKLKLTLKGCLKLIVVVRLISGLSSIVALLLNCPEVEVVGMSRSKLVLSD